MGDAGFGQDRGQWPAIGAHCPARVEFGFDGGPRATRLALLLEDGHGGGGWCGAVGVRGVRGDQRGGATQGFDEEGSLHGSSWGGFAVFIYRVGVGGGGGGRRIEGIERREGGQPGAVHLAYFSQVLVIYPYLCFGFYGAFHVPCCLGLGSVGAVRWRWRPF